MHPTGVNVSEWDRLVLTHGLTPAGPIPTAFDSNGVYPYVSYVDTARRPHPVRYRFVTLENDVVCATICPDLGGRVTSIVHKPSGRETLYAPEVVRGVRVLPRFNFVAGGIEVSFPIAHSPSQSEPVACEIDVTPARTYVTCGERELRFGMQWSVEYSLGPGDTFLTQRLRLHNPGTVAYPWMSWSNASVPSRCDTEFHFPGGEVLSHSSRLDVIDWETQGPRREYDVREMTGFFWRSADAEAFGAFTPSLGSGLYHVASRSDASGMKLWTYGMGPDREWAMLSTARREAYIEIQGGPVADQSVRLMLEPGASRSHAEFWFPTDRPLDLPSVAVPDVRLRPVEQIPSFPWARPSDVRVWHELAEAGSKRTAPPSPPEPMECRWAPSGMEDLDEAFQHALEAAPTPDAELWRLHYGTWLAGRGDAGRAIEVLTAGSVDVGRVLLARLHRRAGNAQAACAALRALTESWLALHPQVVVERDLALRACGSATISEREAWLNRVDALEDEGVIERRVQLLIDRGEPTAAKSLLMDTPFQRVHQSYTRTDLWRQVCAALGEAESPIPETLGEDRLAQFGAYREFE